MKYVISALLLVFSLSSYGNPNSVKFNQAGFSIDVLDTEVDGVGSKPLMMALPAVDGFAANVNVLVQPYPGTLDDYKKLSEAQFSQMGLKTISSTNNGNELYFEYAGKMQNGDLHFYAKAMKVGNLFYLATATNLESEWEKTSKKLKSVIDSFVAK